MKAEKNPYMHKARIAKRTLNEDLQRPTSIVDKIIQPVLQSRRFDS
jgi:hypothetical protein